MSRSSSGRLFLPLTLQPLIVEKKEKENKTGEEQDDEE
jgi:hypothetical protein